MYAGTTNDMRITLQDPPTVWTAFPINQLPASVLTRILAYASDDSYSDSKHYRTLAPTSSSLGSKRLVCKQWRGAIDDDFESFLKLQRRSRYLSKYVQRGSNCRNVYRYCMSNPSLFKSVAVSSVSAMSIASYDVQWYIPPRTEDAGKTMSPCCNRAYAIFDMLQTNVCAHM